MNLFYPGYDSQESDKDFLEVYFVDPHERETTIKLFEQLNTLSPKTLFQQANKITIVLLIIENAFADKIIGSKVNDWKAFANNAIHFHSKHWDYIESAFKKSGLFNKLIDLDKKHTFQKKIRRVLPGFTRARLRVGRSNQEFVSRTFLPASRVLFVWMFIYNLYGVTWNYSQLLIFRGVREIAALSY